MNASPKHVHSLCPACTACPAVAIYEDGTVTIGEAPNLVKLGRAARWRAS